MKKLLLITLLLTCFISCSNNNDEKILQEYSDFTVFEEYKPLSKSWKPLQNESDLYTSTIYSCSFAIMIDESISIVLSKELVCENEKDYQKFTNDIDINTALSFYLENNELSPEYYLVLSDNGVDTHGLISSTEEGSMQYYKSSDYTILFEENATQYYHDFDVNYLPESLAKELGFTPFAYASIRNIQYTIYHYNHSYVFYGNNNFTVVEKDSKSLLSIISTPFDYYNYSPSSVDTGYVEVSAQENSIQQFQAYQHDTSLSTILSQYDYIQDSEYFSGSITIEIEHQRGCSIFPYSFSSDLFSFRCNPLLDESKINSSVIDLHSYLNLSYGEFLETDTIKTKISYYQPHFYTDSNQNPTTFASRAEVEYWVVDTEKVIQFFYKDYNHTSLADSRFGHNNLARFQVYYYNTNNTISITDEEFALLKDNDFSINKDTFSQMFSEQVVPYSYIDDYMTGITIQYALYYKNIALIFHQDTSTDTYYFYQEATNQFDYLNQLP